MAETFHNDWQEKVGGELKKEYFEELRAFLREEYRNHSIYPPKNDVMNAFHATSYEQTKVVLLGQDPYHGKGQAHGLSFSVRPGVKVPPSLVNIYKELNEDLGHPIPEHGCLEPWAEEGVLMMNTVLTVREKEPHSHRGRGWETFTNEVIDVLNKREEPVIFLLWGKPAQHKMERIDTEKHHVLTSPHPSPFSANKGFFGSRPFSRINEILKSQGQEPINWELPVTWKGEND
ncbi:uracil-DNA glycosylase [Alkalicoccus urumqiensis]|uniref:Uracil-DNA glycosylase n=1 Tax=Alkalicoccus urumqiensis TaxID=1548213 RepID=A0A2P6MDB2_ALKUR|nr:uracil-DNA glycosylase [Alkalicoccus urumqiensis]PRO64265.1 uracil-DNA glycosylase [Alkalicoccus urumqiensis]